MRVVFFLLSLSSLLFANVLIDSKHTNLKDFDISYLIDDTHSLRFGDIKDMEFTSSPNRKSHRSTKTNIWIKVKIKNITPQTQNLFLHNSTGYVNKELDFYEIENNKIINQYKTSLLANIGMEYLHGSDAIYPFVLLPKQTKTLYLHIKTFSYQYYEILIFDNYHSIQNLIKKHIFILLIIGIFIALMIYNLMLYFNTKYIDYLYYSIYIFWVTLWVGYEYGLLSHYLDIYGMTAYLFNFTIIIAEIILVIFVKSILDTKSLFPNENRWLDLIILIFILNILYAFLDPFGAMDIFYIVMVISLIIYVVSGISIYIKGSQYISFILIAQFWFIIFGIISLLFYEGFIAYNFLSRHAFGLGIMIEAFFLTYLLSYRINIIRKSEKETKEQNLLQENKLKALGELLDNISHQWRQPLAQINSSVMVLDSSLSKAGHLNTNIENHLNQIESSSIFMSRTIDDFKSIYNKSHKQQRFNLQTSIEDSFAILKSSYTHHNINMQIDIDNQINIFGFKNEFQQAILVILNNAKDALISNTPTDRQVKIKSHKIDNSYRLDICDNAGGIDQSIINQIYNPNFSTKKDKGGTGIGLYMSKQILNDLLNIKLESKNSESGVCFSLWFDDESLFLEL